MSKLNRLNPRANHWLCECGKRPFEGGWDKWRWDGENWQHYHDYPIGHVIAKYKPTEVEEKEEE